MKLKRILSTLLALTFITSSAIPAYADVNLDGITHGDQSSVGRYSHTGGEWGWVVECYVALFLRNNIAKKERI